MLAMKTYYPVRFVCTIEVEESFVHKLGFSDEAFRVIVEKAMKSVVDLASAGLAIQAGSLDISISTGDAVLGSREHRQIEMDP